MEIDIKSIDDEFSNCRNDLSHIDRYNFYLMIKYIHIIFSDIPEKVIKPLHIEFQTGEIITAKPKFDILLIHFSYLYNTIKEIDPSLTAVFKGRTPKEVHWDKLSAHSREEILGI